MTYTIDITVYSNTSKEDAINNAKNHIEKLNAFIIELTVVEESIQNLTGTKNNFKVVCRIKYKPLNQ